MNAIDYKKTFSQSFKDELGKLPKEIPEDHVSMIEEMKTQGLNLLHWF